MHWKNTIFLDIFTWLANILFSPSPYCISEIWRNISHLTVIPEVFFIVFVFHFFFSVCAFKWSSDRNSLNQLHAAVGKHFVVMAKRIEIVMFFGHSQFVRWFLRRYYQNCIIEFITLIVAEPHEVYLIFSSVFAVSIIRSLPLTVISVFLISVLIFKSKLKHSFVICLSLFIHVIKSMISSLVTFIERSRRLFWRRWFEFLWKVWRESWVWVDVLQRTTDFTGRFPISVILAVNQNVSMIHTLAGTSYLIDTTHFEKS